MNKYAPHVYVLPEDDRDRQIALGFALHESVQQMRVKIMPPARGWGRVRETFETEYLPLVRDNRFAHVVLLIDFDGHVDERQRLFADTIPAAVRERVFVVGTKDEPETLKRATKLGFEQIGTALAEECRNDRWDLWNHEQLRHNDAERLRLAQTVRPFLF